MELASKQGDFEFSLEWNSESGKHIDRYHFSRLNTWRDFFPGDMGDNLKDIEPDNTINESFKPGQLVEPYNKNKVLKLSRQKLNFEQLHARGIFLRRGRFYPRAILNNFGFSAQDFQPFRVIGLNDDHITVDTNHPLNHAELTIHGTMLRKLSDRIERGGSCNDIGFSLTTGGPGLQAALENVRTDFFSDSPFKREDERDDCEFYNSPRMVDHIDKTASSHISEIYSRFVKPGMKILDLMSSWNSHIEIEPGKTDLTGLGLNTKELESNPHLTEKVVQNLNSNRTLPFKDSTFDAVICTVSIEYLMQPVEIVKEVSRVLKAGSPFIITFSDRWFPSKAIKIWSELHPFERVGLVCDYLEQSNGFEGIHTESIRGYPRPSGDTHQNERAESDPVFAVWGFKK